MKINNVLDFLLQKLEIFRTSLSLDFNYKHIKRNIRLPISKLDVRARAHTHECVRYITCFEHKM